MFSANYCVCVKRIHFAIACVLLLVIFLPALSGISGNLGHFTDHGTANTINSFRGSFLVLKIHGCY